MSYQSVNPATGKVLKTFKEISNKQLETSLKTAAACFDTWRFKSFTERAVIVSKAAAILRARVDDFAKPVTLEMGKLLAESRGEVELSADILDYYAKNAESFLAPQTLKPNSGEAVIENTPFGVLFGVQPWNFPYYQLARFAAPNLMAGNVVMVKHAGCVPQCAIAFEKLWLEAGAPAGAYTNLFISYEHVNRVIDDSRIEGVALTGSVDAGKSIAARAGQNLKKTTMELGGSDAFIVLEDADLEKTVTWAVCQIPKCRLSRAMKLSDELIQSGHGSRDWILASESEFHGSATLAASAPIASVDRKISATTPSSPDTPEVAALRRRRLPTRALRFRSARPAATWHWPRCSALA